MLASLLFFSFQHLPVLAADKPQAAEALNNPSFADVWHDIKKGTPGRVSIPDKKAAVLIQTEGESWRQFRTKQLPFYGLMGMGGILGLLFLFYLIRGKIRIAAGPSYETIERFTFLERAMHWLLASSFIILALTGLNLLYGRRFLMPLIGEDFFASLTLFGKLVHNFVGISFMIALTWVFCRWVLHNFPSRGDLKWLRWGGGIVGGEHVPAKKFNAGQKIVFWLVIIGGLSISLSGLALMMPFELSLFKNTFAALNVVGFNLPTDLTLMQETKMASQWHGVIALVLVVVVIAHIYIGTIGMEGAFQAMGSGEVDLNWAREHHSLWVKEIEQSGRIREDLL